MLQDITQVVLAKALDATAMRHRAIANNLANIETPDYSRQDVSFEAEMRMALDSPSLSSGEVEKGIRGVEPEMTNDFTQPARENGNNVDADREMAVLAKNTIQYEAILRAIQEKGGMLRTAIYEGRK